jgi:hypothetical protein
MKRQNIPRKVERKRENVKREAEAHLEHASKGQYQTAANTNQEDGGNIEEERDRGIGNENQNADLLELVKWSETFCEGQEEKIDKGANWSVVVQ